jgi:sulfatase modifying factor 1
MKQKAYTLLALLAMVLGMVACSEQAVLAPVATHNPADIALVPYTSEEMGIRGIVPEGWVKVKPGQFQPVPVSDPTLLGQIAFPGATIEQVMETGRFPERVGSMETADFTWGLHHAELEWPDNVGTLVFDVALAEADAGAYLVALVALADEHDALYDGVFMPAVRALGPAVVAEKQHRAMPTAPPAERPAPINTAVRSADGMVTVYVPAGEFEMGNTGVQWVWAGSLRGGDLDLQVFTDEQPQHTVYVDAFWMDQTEVTVAMFRAFVEATGYRTSAEREGWGNPWREGPMEEEWPKVPGADWLHPHGPESSAEDDHPVVQVSWDDAAAYCEWAGGHLPTEAQWEKVARGRLGRLWPWGNTYDGTRGSFCDAQCPIERWKHNTYDDGYALTAPVGSFPSGASPYGALDMAGNVWEWVADWYDDSYYADSPPENPSGPDSGTVRAMRGGSWFDTESWVRCTVRHQNPPWSRCDDVGFRCAMPAEPL